MNVQVPNLEEAANVATEFIYSALYFPFISQNVDWQPYVR